MISGAYNKMFHTIANVIIIGRVLLDLQIKHYYLAKKTCWKHFTDRNFNKSTGKFSMSKSFGLFPLRSFIGVNKTSERIASDSRDIFDVLKDITNESFRSSHKIVTKMLREKKTNTSYRTNGELKIFTLV